jgi:hypothetical protein
LNAHTELAQITPQSLLDRCSAQAFPLRVFDESEEFRWFPQPNNTLGWVDLDHMDSMSNKRKEKTHPDIDSGISPSS